jgi:nucleotide-binding universal stress UspA family protein/hemerythrin
MTPHRPPLQPPVYSAALRHARRQLCARLARTAAEPDEGFARCYAELVAEVEAHLRHEEAVMEACGVKRLEPRLHEQRQENAAVLAAMHHVLPQVEDGQLDMARRLVAALTDILSLHRISADLALPHRTPAPAAPPRMRGRAARGPRPPPHHPPRRAPRPHRGDEAARLSFPLEIPMSLQSILVHADLSRHAPARIHAAALLAREHGAHLTGAAMMGVSRAVFPNGYQVRPGSLSAACFDPLADKARQALSRFEAIASERGVPHDARLVLDEADDGLAMLSRFADLLVVSQDDPAESLSDHVLRMPDYVIMNSARPVLVIPREAAPPDTGFARRVLLGWDGSREAAAATGAAMPLLRRADAVTVAMLSGPALAPSECEAQRDDLLGFLGRHRVRAEVLVRDCLADYAGDTGRALLSMADELGADLLVMGCYGHSRLRELCLGGASRTVLTEARIPALLVH